MAQLIAAFNANQFDPTQGGGGSLPIGKHPVVIEASEVKANGSNDGGYLELSLKIIDGPQAGNSGAYRLNLYNKSEKAVEIAHRQMSALCHVIGVYNVLETNVLHNIPFVIEVGMQKGEDAIAKGYTEVKKVFDINGNEPGKAGAGAQQQQPAQGFAQQQPQGQAQGFAQGQQQQQAPGGWGQQQPAQGQPAGGGFVQQQPQQQQQPAQGGAAAWGQGGQPAQQQQAQPQQQAAPAQGGGWQQQQGAPAGGGQPAWGQK